MDQIVVYSALVFMGLCLGSFAGATVWRLRARQLLEDKTAGDTVDETEFKKLRALSGVSIINDHSRCLKCGYGLKWYDLVPLISWLTLGGKCRKCKKPIGYFEPVIELGVAVFFVASYALWPYHLNNNLELVRLAIWLVAGVGLAILFAYDAFWSLLPDQVSFLVIGLGTVSSLITITLASDKISALWGLVGSIMILSGFYWLIYMASKGRWIGFGDIKLGLGLALLLADWRLAFIALFSANLIGCLIVIPAMLAGKLKRDSHVPFGPLLITGCVIAALVGNYILGLYFYNLV